MQLTKDLGLEKIVTFYGHQTDTAPFFARFDLFLQPSRAEAFGITLIEAMASGLPVIASRVGGIPEVVEDSSTGKLVPPELPESLAEAIAELLQEPDLRSALAKAGSQKATTHFSYQEMTQCMSALYADQLI
jgi:glycosyltransferase involved in cell wall biosynthesis